MFNTSTLIHIIVPLFSGKSVPSETILLRMDALDIITVKSDVQNSRNQYYVPD